MKEAIVAKQDALEKEKVSTAEILKDLDDSLAHELYRTIYPE